MLYIRFLLLLLVVGGFLVPLPSVGKRIDIVYKFFRVKFRKIKKKQKKENKNVVRSFELFVLRVLISVYQVAFFCVWKRKWEWMCRVKFWWLWCGLKIEWLINRLDLSTKWCYGQNALFRFIQVTWNENRLMEVCLEQECFSD